MRYFLQVSYKGTRYAGFQIQQNAITIQSEVEKALQIVFRVPIALTGSSRTDAGVHAYQNYFHFDTDISFTQTVLYNLNSLLPSDIAIKSIQSVPSDAHARFHATSRKYHYHLHTSKDPFLTDTSWFYPYTLNLGLLQQASELLSKHTDFEAFSKRNTQVFTHNCNILSSAWVCTGHTYIYKVEANRFLRGMVRALVGTMLQVAKGKISLQQLNEIILSKDNSLVDFSTPAKGLFLMQVNYPRDYFLE